MNGLLGLGATAWLVLFAFLFVLAVLWFLLPFAVFGSKPRLDKMIAELQTLNKTMKEISAQNRVLVEQQKLFLPRVSKTPADSGGETNISS
jgi:hypothetical protein